MLSDFIIGIQILQKAGATSIYAVHETVVVYGADITAAVEDYGFYWDNGEEAWFWYT